MPLRSWTTEISNQQGYDDTKNPIALSPALHQVIRNSSQFAQLEWKNDNFSFLLGSRLDQNSAIKSTTFSPRATLRYNPTKNINLRATYAKGFRSPQVFDEDLHVGVVGGEAQRVENADDLTPEISHSFSLSSDMYFRLGESRVNLLVEGFYTRLLDVFTNYKDGSRNGITYFIRHNYGFDDQKNKVSSGAKVYGVNLEGKLAYHWMSLQAGLTLTSNMYDAEQEWGVRAKIKDDANIDYKTFVPKADGSSFEAIADENGDAQTVSTTSKHIMRTPSVYGYMTLNLNPIKPLNISLTGTYTGSMYVPHAVKWGQNSGINDRNAIAAKLRTEGYELPLLENNAPNNPLMEDSKQKKATPEWNELIKSKPFFDLGAKVSYDFRIFSKTDIQLFMGVNNIFNAFQDDYDFGPNRDSAYIYGPTMPASGYVGFKLNL